MTSKREPLTLSDVQPAIDSLCGWLDENVGSTLEGSAACRDADAGKDPVLVLRNAVSLVATRFSPTESHPSTLAALPDAVRKRAQAVAWSVCMLEDFAGLLDSERGCYRLLQPFVSAEELARIRGHEERSEKVAERGRTQIQHLNKLLEEAAELQVERTELAVGPPSPFFVTDVAANVVRPALEWLTQVLMAAARQRPFAEGFVRLSRMPDTDVHWGTVPTELIAAAAWLLDIATALLCSPLRFNPGASQIGASKRSRVMLFSWLARHLRDAGFSDAEVSEILKDSPDQYADPDDAKLRVYRRRKSLDD